MDIYILYYLAAGTLAGLLAGLFGIGGGMIIVPALIYIFKAQGIPEAALTHVGIGTSLATIIITSISSLRAHNSKDECMETYGTGIGNGFIDWCRSCICYSW
nr:sulfite exporter TauE/SafE family protein [Arenibacter amylolyticus]